MSVSLYLNLIIPLILSAASFINSKNFKYLIISSLSLGLVGNNLFLLFANTPQAVVLTTIMPNYDLVFKTDPLAIIFALMVSTLNLLTNIYSFFYIAAENESNKESNLNPRTYFFFTPLAIMSAFGAGYAANLLTLFIFYELLTFATYPLVIQSLSTSARKAGKTYLSILFFSSSFFIMFALVYLDKYFQGSDFKIGGFIKDLSMIEQNILLFCFVIGFSKIAIFPMHKWLIEAMVAPIPVSGLLHAVAVVKTGVFALIKVMIYVIGIDNLSNLFNHRNGTWFLIISSSTIIYASIKAIKENNLKKILAYSTIIQLSYMMVFLSFVSKKMVAAVFGYMLSHSIAKICLFFTIGILYSITNEFNLLKNKGFFRNMPIVGILFVLAAFSIMSLPFSSGYLYIDMIYKNISTNISGIIVILVLLLSSILSCTYFTKIIFNMLIPNKIEQPIQRNTWIYGMILITSITFLLSILLIIYSTKLNCYLQKIFV